MIYFEQSRSSKQYTYWSYMIMNPTPHKTNSTQPLWIRFPSFQFILVRGIGTSVLALDPPRGGGQCVAPIAVLTLLQTPATQGGCTLPQPRPDTACRTSPRTPTDWVVVVEVYDVPPAPPSQLS